MRGNWIFELDYDDDDDDDDYDDDEDDDDEDDDDDDDDDYDDDEDDDDEDDDEDEDEDDYDEDDEAEESLFKEEALAAMPERIPAGGISIGSINDEVGNWTSWEVDDHFYPRPWKQPASRGPSSASRGMIIGAV